VLYSIKIGSHPRDDPTKYAEIACRNAIFGFVRDALRHNEQFVAQPLAFAVRKTRTLRRSSSPRTRRISPDAAMPRSAITVVGSIMPTRADNSRCDKSVGVPQHPQEIPLAARHAVGGDAPLQQPLKSAVRVAHQIAGGEPRRKLDRAAGTCFRAVEEGRGGIGVDRSVAARADNSLAFYAMGTPAMQQPVRKELGAVATPNQAFDLRATLEWLRASGELIETDKEVDPDLQVTGLQKHMDGGCPVCSTTSKASRTIASSPTCSATWR
jgi:hypothetical protein